jgi:hypothetical protein
VVTFNFREQPDKFRELGKRARSGKIKGEVRPSRWRQRVLAISESDCIYEREFRGKRMLAIAGFLVVILSVLGGCLFEEGFFLVLMQWVEFIIIGGATGGGLLEDESMEAAVKITSVEDLFLHLPRVYPARSLAKL